MEDMLNALLDVVRAQHTATQGTDEAPFDMDDVIDMAMNLLGRPDDKEEEQSMIDEIQSKVESLAPDIFPPKTFEEMNDSEKVLSASSMIENRFMNGGSGSGEREIQPDTVETVQPAYSYQAEESQEGEPDSGEEPDPGDLNDLIYRNFMEMMGLSSPKVEYPFDRTQVVYGKEKSFTEMMEEEEEEKSRRIREEADRDRKLSAWELAQDVIDKDEAAHAKEEYVPKPVEPPVTKSASQMANEAIRKAEEEKRMKLEIERQAEALMEEARKRGKNPMDFMLHQQEILRYMEKNSDELVSFEDYEDLSPEEKLEIERQVYIERQLAEGINPEDVDRSVPEEYVPEELKNKPQDTAEPEQEAVTTFDEDVLRALSQQVLSENSDMILSENANEDMVSLQEELFENLKRMMTGSGTPVPQESVASLLSQATANQMAAFEDNTEDKTETVSSEVTSDSAEEEPRRTGPMSAVELAMAAQKASKPRPEDVVSAVEPPSGESVPDGEPAAGTVTETSEEAAMTTEAVMSPDEVESPAPEAEIPEEAETPDETAAQTAETEIPEEAVITEPKMTSNEPAAPVEEDKSPVRESVPESNQEEASEEEEFEYVDPDEMVLGDHTQAEVDEALENLSSLGLDGEVFERAKRMLLLELAGSEAALEAWLQEQENSSTKKKATVSALDEDKLDDLSDFDEDLFEKELDMAIEEDFEEQTSRDMESETEDAAESENQEISEESDEEEEGTEGLSEDGSEEDKSGEDESGSIGIDESADEGEGHLEEETPDMENNEVFVEEVSEETEEETEVDEEKGSREADRAGDAEERGYQISVRKPFILKNSTSFIDKLEDYITENQENRRLSTGFKKLDGLLRFGLHKGSYFIDARPQYLKNAFMQQIADRAAESGVDVLYISTELSRYDLMVDSLSRLSYDMNGHNAEKAHSVMSIMTGEEGASLEDLSDELNWYRGRISEHLFILDQEAVDEFIDSLEEEVSAGEILEELIRSIVKEGSHKPVVFIDNIENILSVEDSEDMKPLMDGIGKLSKELSIPIIMSYGYEQMENEEEISFEEREFHESLGNMCDVYLELEYADMITENSIPLSEEDIREMAEDGETLLFNVLIYRNRRPMRASCQIQGTPKYNYFEE